VIIADVTRNQPTVRIVEYDHCPHEMPNFVTFAVNTRVCLLFIPLRTHVAKDATVDLKRPVKPSAPPEEFVLSPRNNAAAEPNNDMLECK
jgi:hypothetical protein